VISELIIFVAAPNRIFQGLSLPRNTRECGSLRLCPAVLLANKGVHREAGFLTSYLDHIGPQNASFLRHIYIAFPAFDDYHHLESVTLKEDSIRTLERIRDNSTNLATLKTSLRFQTINIMESMRSTILGSLPRQRW